MTYRSLLVFLDCDPLSVVRTQVAMRLAATFGSHLIGLAPTGLVNMPASTALEAGVNDFSARLAAALQEQAERAAAQFIEQCREAGVTSFETLVETADKANSVNRHSQHADLTLLTQPDPRGDDHAATLDLLEDVLMHSARPTLVLPYVGRHDAVGSRVLVAWNESREAVRAVSDALPWLRLADKVTVVRWSKGRLTDDPNQRGRMQAVQQWLKRHNVDADVHLENMSGIGIADAVLSRAADLNADLIVMGAYGRARWTERILGGATRGLLESMTAPVLMSH